MKVFIVILNYNGGKNTLLCLQSLKNLSLLDKTELKIVVVDNASKDDSVSKIKAEYPKIVVLQNKENLGFSEGNNVGISYALNNQASYVLILNNDTIVDKNFLKELIIASEKDKKIGIVSPKIYFEKSFEFHKDRYEQQDLGKVLWYAGGVMDWENILGYHRGVDEVDHGQYNKEQELDYATGCCMLIKKEVIEKIGLFERSYHLYYEDSDFSMRVKKAGYKIIYAPKAILWHKNAGSAGGSGSELQDYYTTRNRLLFGLKYAPLKSKIAMTKESLKLLANGRKWQKWGVLDFYLKHFGKGRFAI